MNFGDVKFAADLRDLISKMAMKVIKENVPDLRIGKVFRVDASGEWAYILFPGEAVTNLVKVRCARDKIPSVVMESGYDSLGLDAPGDVVRIWGKPGSYFILDFVSGGPVTGSNPVGIPMPWMTDTAPTNHILLQGQDVSRSLYPDLFAVWGETYGAGDGIETFGVPNGQLKFLYGADGSTVLLGSTGGSSTRTLSEANLAPHDHSIIMKIKNISDTDTGGAGMGHRLTDVNDRLGTGGTNYFVTGMSTEDAGSGTAFSIMPPYLAVNWIVRAVA